ncbi:alpha/beta fold hydrolase [Mycoplasmopsis cricetuli]|uniref:alpha/beta fold hydrolase n=1 Tax=Mycoplasmopsis cricetuli TaxID=171283 RepID=UPI00068889AC|nr:alpha/beta hydrolase [Mycoplasmopsis cricetuli]
MQSNLKKWKYPSISYFDENNKKTIVMVHGFNGSCNGFLSILEKIPNANYYCFTLPGCSSTPATLEQMSVEYYAQLVVEFINFHNLKNVILIGHSMGGGIISLVYKLASKLISKIVFISPMNRSARIKKDFFLKTYFPTNFEEYKIFIKSLYYDNSFVDTLAFEKYRETFNSKNFTNKYILKLGYSLPQEPLFDLIESGIQSITIPSLLILGEFDTVIPTLPAKKYFTQHNSTIQIKVINNVGHMVFEESPEEFLKILNTFIAQ